MKKVTKLTFIYFFIILTGCTSLTPPPKTPQIILKKSPEKRLYKKKEQLALSVDVKYLLSLKDQNQLSEYVKVRDRNGNLITHLPVYDGQISVFMDFTPSLLELRYKDKDVPISIVVYHVCSILEKDVICNKVQSSFKKFNSVDELLINEICWNERSYSWEFKFTTKLSNTSGVVSLDK